MSTAWVWALRAIRLLKVVAHRWLREEYADLMEHALADLSEPAESMQQVSPCPPSPPDVLDHNQVWNDLIQQSFDPSWPGDLFPSGLSFFDLDRWPEI